MFLPSSTYVPQYPESEREYDQTLFTRAKAKWGGEVKGRERGVRGGGVGLEV